jgi:hypothetical protein
MTCRVKKIKVCWLNGLALHSSTFNYHAVRRNQADLHAVYSWRQRGEYNCFLPSLFLSYCLRTVVLVAGGNSDQKKDNFEEGCR